MIRGSIAGGYSFLKILLLLIVLGALLWLLQRQLTQKSRPAGSQTRPPATTSTHMSVSRAAELLGVPTNAARSDIVKAHRRLMQKVHPDKGGSPALARDLNEAKLVLLQHESRGNRGS